MKKQLLALTATFCMAAAAGAQTNVGIGTITPNASAQLDVSATNKGFLAPRVALTGTGDVTTIPSPATGLMVYNTTAAGSGATAVLAGYHYFNGTQWVKLTGTTVATGDGNIYVNDGTLTGNRTVTMAGNSLNFTGGNVGFGTAAPNSRLSNTATGLSDQSGTGTNGFGLTWIAANGGSGYTTTLGNTATGNNSNGLLVRTTDNTSGSRPFTVDVAGTDVLAVQGNGNVGVGTSAPNSRLSNTATSLADQSSVGTNGFGLTWIAANGGAGYTTTLGNTATGSNSNGLLVRTTDNTSGSRPFTVDVAGTDVLAVQGNGNVGVGVVAPVSKLEVKGAAVNAASYNAGSGTTIDFSQSNLARTSAAGGTITLNNLRDGGTYTLAIENNTGGTYTFAGTTLATASVGATTVNFASPNNGATTAGKYTIFTFLVIGTTAYFYMTPGF